MTVFAYNNNRHKNTKVVFNKILKRYLLNLENVFKNKILKEKTSFAIKRAKILRNNLEHLIDF